MKSTRSLLITLVVCTVALAGCTGGGGGKSAKGPTAVSGCVGEACGDFTLGDGQGAVSGLVIDDRLRPIAETRVLLLPLGLSTETNENGEFGFVGLEPGTYTIKAQKAKHEAAPKRVDVVAGQYSEAIIEARRTVSDNSMIITQEYAIFIPCSMAVGGSYVTAGFCAGLSGDTYRPGIRGIDLTETANLTYLVSELKANRDGQHLFTVREDNGSPFGGETYGRQGTETGNYARIQMQIGEAAPGGVVWNNDKLLSMLMFPSGTVGPVNTPSGTGAEMGTRGQVIMSIFIGEPEVDIDTYAVLQ